MPDIAGASLVEGWGWSHAGRAHSQHGGRRTAVCSRNVIINKPGEFHKYRWRFLEETCPGFGVRVSRAHDTITTAGQRMTIIQQQHPRARSRYRDAPLSGFLGSARGCHRDQGLLSESRVRVSLYLPSGWRIEYPHKAAHT